MAFFKVALFALLAAAATAAPSQNPANVAEYERALANGEVFDNNPEYNYEFQVADDKAQTYISQNENRNGDDVTGQYSYVDPTGALVTVTYSAGIDGYTEERDVQEAFVAIRAKPVSKTTSSSSSSSGLVSKVVSQVTPVVKKTVTTTTSSSASGDGDLVARIIAQLTPFIRTTVANSLQGEQQQQQVVTTRRVVEQKPVAVSVPAPVVATRKTVTTTSSSSGSATEGIFGVAGQNNVKFSAPEFNYAFDL